MPFLPKSRERYYAALRVMIQNRILKYGPTIKQMKNLKKIAIAEALYRPAHPVCTNVAELCDSLLGSCLLKLSRHKKYLSTAFVGGGNYFVDQKLLLLLLLELTATCFEGKHCEISVNCEEDGIRFTATGKAKKGYLAPLVKKSGAALFKDSAANVTVIHILAQKTDEIPPPNLKEWEYLCDPLSLIHIFLSDMDL